MILMRAFASKQNSFPYAHNRTNFQYPRSETMSHQAKIIMQEEVNDLDWQVIQARQELHALRVERLRRSEENSRQGQALETEHYDAKSSLHKSLNQLGMSEYKNAVLETQISAVQPYILQKLAVLCHALHHTEVAAKQIQMMQKSAEELEIVLETSIDQIEDFWEPRLLHLTESICWSKTQVYEMASRLPNGEAFLRNSNDEQKENCEPPHQNSTFVSVLSMVMAAGRFHQVPTQNKSFLPVSQSKKPVGATARCDYVKAMASFNSAQQRRLSA